MEKKDLRLWTSTENLGKQEGRAGWDDLLLGGGQKCHLFFESRFLGRW